MSIIDWVRKHQDYIARYFYKGDSVGIGTLASIETLEYSRVMDLESPDLEFFYIWSQL